jgi:hypothetical protein
LRRPRQWRIERALRERMAGMTEAVDSGSSQSPQDTRNLIERYRRMALSVATGVVVVAVLYFAAVFLMAPR